MLSHAGALLLGMVAERPANPYELKKILEKIRIKKWLPVAGSTVYAVMRNLAAKGYCEGTPEREGGMPEKTVYAATEKGVRELNETLAAYLGDTGLDTKKFNIAVLMICHLNREDALGILQSKIERLKKIETYLCTTLYMTKSAIPYTGVCVIEHELSAIQAETESTIRLLECALKDTEWSTFMARDSWFS